MAGRRGGAPLPSRGCPTAYVGAMGHVTWKDWVAWKERVPEDAISEDAISEVRGRSIQATGQRPAGGTGRGEASGNQGPHPRESGAGPSGNRGRGRGAQGGTRMWAM